MPPIAYQTIEHLNQASALQRFIQLMVGAHRDGLTRDVPKMLFSLFFLAAFPAFVLGAQQVPLTNPISSPFTTSFDKLVRLNMDRWHTPGLAVAVIHGEDTFSKV